MKFSIGADPEIFLVNGSEYKSAIGLIGANKWNPRKLSEVGHAVLEDNVAIEFNIPACETFEAFKKEIKGTMQQIKEMLPPSLEYSKVSAVSFPEKELMTEEAWVFGCEPDLNAWTGKENPKPHAPDPNLRSCGGHIHVGHELAQKYPFEVVQAMDAYLGLNSLELDKGTLRRALYGNAGACRIKPYGVEYRTLSNFWIFDDSTIQWAYENTEKALEFVQEGYFFDDVESQAIQKCINTSDINMAKQLKLRLGI